MCNTPGDCVEEVADTTMSLILNMYRKTFWLAKAVSEGKKVLLYFVQIKFFQVIPYLCFEFLRSYHIRN